MKRNIRSFVFPLLFLLPSFVDTYAGVSSPTMSQIDSGLRVEINSKGEEVYYRRSDTEGDQEITSQEFKTSLEGVLKKFLQIACQLSAIPNTVTITVGFGVGGMSLTWNLNDNLCKKNEK